MLGPSSPSSLSTHIKKTQGNSKFPQSKLCGYCLYIMIGTELSNGMKIDSAHLKVCKARIEHGFGAGQSLSLDPQFIYYFCILGVSDIVP